MAKPESAPLSFTFFRLTNPDKAFDPRGGLSDSGAATPSDGGSEPSHHGVGSFYKGEHFRYRLIVRNALEKDALRSILGRAELHGPRGTKTTILRFDEPFDLDPGTSVSWDGEAEIREAGAHSVNCSAEYTTGQGERKQVAQPFRIEARQSLSIKTKARKASHSSCILEATVENAIEDAMKLVAVSLDASPMWAVSHVNGNCERVDGARATFASEDDSNGTIVEPSGCFGCVFSLARQEPLSQMEDNSVGKLELEFLSPSGGHGTLITHPVTFSSGGNADVYAWVSDFPLTPTVGSPFDIEVTVNSRKASMLSKLRARVGESGQRRYVFAHGPNQSSIEQGGHARFCMIAVRPGLLRLPPIFVEEDAGGGQLQQIAVAFSQDVLALPSQHNVGHTHL